MGELLYFPSKTSKEPEQLSFFDIIKNNPKYQPQLKRIRQALENALNDIENYSTFTPRIVRGSKK